jgi:hypothetical protein
MNLNQTQTYLERCFRKPLRAKLSFVDVPWSPELAESWSHEPLAICENFSIGEMNKKDQGTRTTVRFGGSGGLF